MKLVGPALKKTFENCKNYDPTDECSNYFATYHLVYREQGVDIQKVSPPVVWTVHMVICWRFKYGVIEEPFH